MAPTPIDTFVFLGLEATDTIRGTTIPSIIELALVAVSRRYIEHTYNYPQIIPRVLHKLVIPMCPKESVSANSARRSNLTNACLEDVKPFDPETCKLIKQFLKRLPGVICFVAQKGINYTYRVFLHAISKQKEYFPFSLRCVDSMKAFQEFFDKAPYNAPPSFELSVLHKWLVGSEPISEQSAEAESINLIRCVSQVRYFTQWADRNAIRFHNVKIKARET